MTTEMVAARPNHEVQQLIGVLEPPTAQPSIDALRTGFETFMRDMYSRGPMALVNARDETCGRHRNVRVRIYEPTDDPDESMDVIVFLHGGGWVAGDLFTGDAGARALARGLGIRVVSVDYRLAPEWPFPAALEDTIVVIEEFAGRPSTRRVIVAGESAGGNLAAAAASSSASASSRGSPTSTRCSTTRPRANHTCAMGQSSASRPTTSADTSPSTRELTDPADPASIPLNATNLAGVPPCLIATAGFDPLLDDGARYAKRLIDAGVPVTYLSMPTMLHGWWSLITASEAARQELGRLLTAARWLIST